MTDRSVTAPFSGDSRGFADDENAVLREAVQKLILTHGSQVKVAALLEVTQGFISSFMKERHGAGRGLGRRIAEASGTTLHAMLGWGGEAEPEVYPNRARGIAVARLMGMPERAVATVRRMKLSPDAADHEPRWWWSMVVAYSVGSYDEYEALL